MNSLTQIAIVATHYLTMLDWLYHLGTVIVIIICGVGLRWPTLPRAGRWLSYVLATLILIVQFVYLIMLPDLRPVTLVWNL